MPGRWEGIDVECPSCGCRLDPDSAYCPACGDATGTARRPRLASQPGTELVEAGCVTEAWPESALPALRRLSGLGHGAFPAIHRVRAGDAGQLEVVREEPPGEPLSERLRAEGGLRAEEAVHVLRQVASAMEAAADAALDDRAPAPEDLRISGRGAAASVRYGRLPLRRIAGGDTAVLAAGVRETAPRLPGRAGLAGLARELLAGRPTHAPLARLAEADPDIPAPLAARIDRALADTGGRPTELGRELTLALLGPQLPLRRRPRWWLVVALVAAFSLGLWAGRWSAEEAKGRSPAATATRVDVAKARRLAAGGRLEAALRVLSPSGGVPDVREARELMAQTLEELALGGDPARVPEAVRVREALLADRPRDARSLRGLGVLHVLRGDFGAAAAHFDAALVAADSGGGQLSPEERRATLNDAAVAHAASGDPARAELLLSELLRESPDDARALANRGMLHLAAGRSAAAEGDLRAALLREPSLPEIRVGLAELQRRSGRLQAASSELGTLDRGTLAAGDNLRAMLAEDEGDLERALQLYRAALDAAPSQAVLQESVARLRSARR